MISISERLVQAIVGKGLYEHYKQRQIAPETQAVVNLAWGQRRSHLPQTQDPPYALPLHVSSTSSAASDAIKNLTADVFAYKSASTVSHLNHQPSTVNLGHSPLLTPIGPALIPEYQVVHNHWSRTTGDVESPNQSIMEVYEYEPLNTGPAIGFQSSTTCRRVRPPPRKVTDLEGLPPLSSKVAAEMTRSVKVLEQARVFAEIRKAREQEYEDQKRADRAAQIKVPPYVAHILTPYSAEDLEDSFLSEPTPTPLVRPERELLQTRLNQHRDQTRHHAGDEPKQRNIRWGPEPEPRRRRNSLAPKKKGHRGRRTISRNEIKRF